SFAEAEPEPFTLANLTTKSLTALILDMAARLRRVEQEFLHVPGAGRAALRAQPAMQAHVFVFHHDPPGFERLGDIEILSIRVRRGRRQTGAQFALGPVRREGDAVHRADVYAGVALDAFGPFEHGLDVAVQAAFGF